MDGNVTGRTVVHRESPWDDTAREHAYQLHHALTRAICPCGCGLPAEVAWDKEQAFMVDTLTCYAGRALSIVEEEYEAQWAAHPHKRPRGVRHYVVPVEDQRERGADGALAASDDSTEVDTPEHPQPPSKRLRARGRQRGHGT